MYPSRTEHSGLMYRLHFVASALGIIPLILLFVLGLICTPRKTLDDYTDDEEADALKIHSPSSPLSSSTHSSSESIASGAGSSSPQSTRSALVVSRTRRSSSQSNVIRATNTSHRASFQSAIRLPRWSSQPEHLARERSDLAGVCVRRTGTVRLRVGPTTRSAIRAVSTTKSISSPRAVSFQLPSRTPNQAEPTSKHRLQVQVFHSPIPSTAEMTDLSEPLSEHIATAHPLSTVAPTDNGHKPTRYGRANRESWTDTRALTGGVVDTVDAVNRRGGVENKLFVLPAHFELAALRLGENRSGTSDPIQQSRVLKGE
ncbi:unnamed protein product [Echinostoma caproni]|uniref:Transmembrane protein n=1 Tax=Echinostoma caproni TaxID=27848 RepID=A0A183AYB9_9TREM|nr:unnamed protein product [Echinostoma caproni]